MLQLKHALRSLFRPPLIAVIAILSLALGVGANTAIFSIFEQFLLRPLAVEDPARLVNLSATGPIRGSISNNSAGNAVFSYPMFRDLEAAGTQVEIAAHRSFGANLSYEGNTLAGSGMLVSGSYFPVLGLRPALGRLFDRQDDVTPGAHPLAVLSHRYWTQRFDRDPSVLNQPIVVNGTPLTIVGVAPSGFDGTTLGLRPEVFVPISMRGVMSPGWEGFDNPSSYWVYVFGRLADGATPESALASINAVYQPIVQEIELPLQEGVSDDWLARFREKALALEPGFRGQSSMHEDVQTPMILLLAVTGFVLLIACANVANLLLAKATNRAREIGIRLSIGARRHQVVRQLLTESFLLALLGGALGLVVALWTVHGIQTMLPAQGAELLQFELRGTTWLFLAVLWVVTGLAGLFPALHSTRHDLVSALKQGAQSSGGTGAARFRNGMVIFQIALSMALLISAGLFTRSLFNVSRVDLGLDAGNLATFAISPELNGYQASETQTLFERLEGEIAALPGVEQVSGSMVGLITSNNWGTNVSVEGFESGPDIDSHSSYDQVGPGFFRTLGIPLLAGREFDVTDQVGRPSVAIVNETFARKFGLGRDAVGRWMAPGETDEPDIQIVGLVQDAKYSEVKDETPAVFYLPYRQDEDLGFLNYYVRTKGDPEQILPTLRATVARLDPDLPIENLRTMELQIEENIFLDRFLTILSASFAVLATLLAAAGLYGVLAYSVSQRRREIGMRMALGADSGDVRRLVLGRVALLTVPGALLGVLAALGMGRVAGSLLFELEGVDPGVIVVAVVLLLAVAFVAGLAPAQRAASIDPLTALREE